MLLTTKLTHENMWDALFERVPEFKPIFDEDVEFNGGEILSHGLLSALFRLTREALEGGNIVLFARVIDFINLAAMSEDEDVLNPVHVSFMELVPTSTINDAALPLLNSAARKMYDAIINWTP